jgi:hypothetical protein
MRHIEIFVVTSLGAWLATSLACSEARPTARALPLTAASLQTLVDVDEPPPPPADPCAGVTCDWGQTCGADGACHDVCADNQATCKASESPNASYVCCDKQCKPGGGCDTESPRDPGCPGSQVQCGHVCCPIMHACVNSSTGQCQVDF